MFCQKSMYMPRKLKGKEKMSAWETMRHLVLFERVSVPSVAVFSLQTARYLT